jgi:shikimate kinase
VPGAQQINHVVVLGLMGAGKTTVGRALGVRIGWSFSDSDETIEREQGETVRRLAKHVGIQRMHALEAQHLLRALRGTGASVVAAAASTVEDPTCREQLERPDVFVVWLDVGLDSLLRRFPTEHHRPLLDASPRRMLRAQAQLRRPLFEAVADLRVRERGRRPAQVIDRILEALVAHGVQLPYAPARTQ